MPSTLLKSLIAVSVLVSNAPAFAAASDAPQKTKLKYNAKTRKYCMTEPATTGTLLDRVTCLTAAKWSAKGLDMPNSTLLEQTEIAQK